MNPNESIKTFEEFARSKGIELTTSTPRAGIQTMLEFRAERLCTACSDDMLLYQWGSYDWGNGKYFELNITRQFVETDLEDDDAISQLGLKYQYKASAEMDAIGAGNRWEDGPSDFREFILASAAFIMVADTAADRIEISHSYV